MAQIRSSPSGKQIGSILSGTIEGPIASGSFTSVAVPVPGARPGDFMIPSVPTVENFVVVVQSCEVDTVNCSVLNFDGVPASSILVRFQQLK